MCGVSAVVSFFDVDSGRVAREFVSFFGCCDDFKRSIHELDCPLRLLFCSVLSGLLH
jgi:hypothetical protein